MKRIMILLLLLTAAWLFPFGDEIYACNVCHSKNPRMVRMHEELGFKDCFRCHGQGLARTPEEEKTQMTGDGRCTTCHKK